MSWQNSGEVAPAAVSLSLRKQKLKLKPQLPAGPEAGLLDVIVGRKRSVHRLLADPENLAETTTEGNRPSVAAVRLPVSGG